MVLARCKAAGMSRRDWGRMRTMSAASIATSVPEDIAIPTFAVASAGESFMPSPTMATISPEAWSDFIIFCFLSGETEE